MDKMREQFEVYMKERWHPTDSAFELWQAATQAAFECAERFWPANDAHGLATFKRALMEGKDGK